MNANNCSRIRRTGIVPLRTVLERGREEEDKVERELNGDVSEVEPVEGTPKNKSIKEEEKTPSLLSWPSIIVVISPGEE